MKLTRPRVEPVSMEEYLRHPHPGTPRALASSAVNLSRTWMRFPALMAARAALGRHLLGPDASLPRRERELGIMRMGVLRRCDYELVQHRIFNLEDHVLTEDEMQRLVIGPDAAGWSDLDAALLRAVDEMHQDAFISEATWTALSSAWSSEQLMDFIVLAGQYWTVATMLNCVGVQLEPGKEPFLDV